MKDNIAVLKKTVGPKTEAWRKLIKNRLWFILSS